MVVTADTTPTVKAGLTVLATSPITTFLAAISALIAKIVSFIQIAIKVLIAQGTESIALDQRLLVLTAIVVIIILLVRLALVVLADNNVDLLARNQRTQNVVHTTLLVPITPIAETVHVVPALETILKILDMEATDQIHQEETAQAITISTTYCTLTL